MEHDVHVLTVLDPISCSLTIFANRLSTQFGSDSCSMLGRPTRDYGGSVANSNVRRRRRGVDPLLR